MSLTSSQGNTQVTVQFALDCNIDAAAQDIQAAISKAAGRLPLHMPRPPSFQKVKLAERPIRYLSLNSKTLPLYVVNGYGDMVPARRISMASDVSRVNIFGAQLYAVRVQLNPDELAARNIGLDEVQRAIQASNTNLPTGRLDGRNQAFIIGSSGSLEDGALYRP